MMKCARGALQAQVHGEGHSLGCFLDEGTRACGRWGDDAETLESERLLGPLMLWGSAGTSRLETRDRPPGFGSHWIPGPVQSLSSKEICVALRQAGVAAKLGWQPVRRPPVVGGQLKADS